MPVRLERVSGAPAFADTSTPLRIGLVNNMPDAALRATERQFTALLRHASEDLEISLGFFALPSVPRGAIAKAHIAAAYLPLRELFSQPLDALIITGAEPLQPSLEQEAYWPELTTLVAWAREHTRSTVCSCLAAHAAVRALDGIGRLRSREKAFGVFACHGAAEHPLLAGLPVTFCTPHSRWNGLPEAELAARGYQVLSRTAEGAVDLFVKQQERSLFICFQGHPEYAADTLLREFRRDVGRFCQSERDTLPLVPTGYFDAATEHALARLWESAGRLAGAALLAECTTLLHAAHPMHSWQPSAISVYRNWLRLLADPQELSLPFAPPELISGWVGSKDVL